MKSSAWLGPPTDAPGGADRRLPGALAACPPALRSIEGTGGGLDEAWDSPHNRALPDEMPRVYASVIPKGTPPYAT
jgi:hypothetical protein